MTDSNKKLSYITVLRAPHAVRTFSAALIGRFSYGVVFLSMVLAITHSTGSYAVAGVFMALFGMTTAFLSPVRAWFIDRYGLRKALPPMVTVYALLLAIVATTTWSTDAPHVVLWVLGAATGSFAPPLGPVMRTLWRDLLDGDLLQRAYSLDTIAEELCYVTGPLLVGVLTAFIHPALGVVVSAGLVFTGAFLMLASPAVSLAQQRADARREQTASERCADAATVSGSRRRRGLAMIRAQPGVAEPVLIATGVGMCLGAINLLVVAFTAAHHNIAAAAWVEAALAGGSVIGGLLYGARTWRVTSRMRLSLLALTLGVAVAAAGFSTNIVLLTVLVGVVGLFLSPALATAYLTADEAAPPDARTQAGAWVNTGFNMGDSGGVAGIGLFVGRLPLVLCFALAGAPAVLTAAVSLTRGRRKPSASSVDPVMASAGERG